MHIDKDHRIVNDDGEDFRIGKDLITPHKDNFDSAPNLTAGHLNTPELIVMHYTGGTNMESTINAFLNAPRDPSSGASAHLLVGRDGSVVQFLPFNRIAYHTGFSWWEGKKGINQCSIGIELDNAGELNMKAGQWHPRHQDQVTIPAEEVQQSEYWKRPASMVPAWQKFTDVQLAVALHMIQALAREYPGIRDILGHDQINLALRDDPGPLLPMPQWRMILFGREQPKIVEYVVNQRSELYANVEGNLPNTKSVSIAQLPENSLVSLKELQAEFALVTVIKSGNPNARGRGWVLSRSLQELSVGRKTKTTRSQPFYKAGVGVPTLKINDGRLFPLGTRVRIQEFQGEWALVALLDRVNGLGEVDQENGKGGVEGWMPKDFLTRKVE